VWPGQPMTAHWGIEDPAAVEGTDLEKEAAFVAAFRYLKNRISIFTAFPFAASTSLRSEPGSGKSDAWTDRVRTAIRQADVRL